MTYVHPVKAWDLIHGLPEACIDLILIDPPYYEIVKDSWDNQWASESQFVDWLAGHVMASTRLLKPNGSLIMFGGIGKHGSRPFFRVMDRIESQEGLTYRNLITWKKRRAYGKSHDYLFCREEIVWYSRNAERTGVTFNIPLLDTKRGYAGFDPKYPAKSEFKRVSNVWADIPELMRPSRNCEKPLTLLKRLIETHSNPGDCVCDYFAGSGATGVAALKLGRGFIGAEAIPEDAARADARCANHAAEEFKPSIEVDE